MDIFLGKACILLIVIISLKYQLTLGQNRIIGGDATEIARFPYMLRLNIGRKTGNLISICGASIIGKEWAVTAAHCFDNPENDFNKIYVIAGSANVKRLERTASVQKVIRVVKHELYSGIPSKNFISGDIAVLKVSPGFTYNQVIQPVKLPGQVPPSNIKIGTVSGWGHTKPNGTSPDILRYVTVPQVTPEICKRKYIRGGITLKEGEICYGINVGKVKDKCQGDSGGPLVNSDRVLLGLVSWGVDCGTKGYPGVYTDAVYYRNWIRAKTGI